NCDTVLKAAKLDDCFDVRVDGNTVRAQQLAGKPAPDTYLMAAKLLGVEPIRSVVVEDAISGVQAGRKGNFGLVIGVARKGNAEDGTFINGFYETRPIVYGEEAYGFAKTGQTIVNVTDSKIIKLFVDDEPFWLPTARFLSYDRRLNMQSGTLDREILWETPSGKQVLITSRRLVSFVNRHVPAIS